MYFATRVRTWRVVRLYSEIALSRKLFRVHIKFCLELPILWPRRILTFPPVTHSVCKNIFKYASISKAIYTFERHKDMLYMLQYSGRTVGY
jgi:hypothetical protein